MTDPTDLPKKFQFSHRLFLRRGALVAGIRFTGLLSVFVLQIVIARLIDDTAQYGIYAWGQSLMFMVGALACMGVPVICARFIASLSAHRNYAAIGAVIRRSTLLLLGSSGVSLACAATLLVYGQRQAIDNVYFGAATIALMFAPAITFCLFLKDLSRARQWLALALIPMQLARPWITGLLFLLLALLFPAKITGQTALLLLGSAVIVVLIMHYLIWRQRCKHDKSTDSAAQTLDEFHHQRILGTAFPVFLTRIAGLVITYSNVLLVGFLAGPAVAGAYFAAERLASLAVIPGNVVSMVNQQSMAAMHSVGERANLQRLVRQSAHGSLWPTAIICVLLFVFATPLLMLFGADFVSAQTALLVLAVSAVVRVASGPAQDILIMTGNQQYVPKVVMVAACAHVAALLLLVPQYGALGAAVASLASSIVNQAWLMNLAKRKTGYGTSVFHGWRAAR